MSKKILFVANTDMHINLCYIPYIKYLKENGYEVHVATDTDTSFDYCDKKIKLSIERKPFKLKNLKAISELKRVLYTEKYDLISASTPMGSVIARIASKKTKKENNTKLIYTAHGFHFYKGSSFFSWLVYYPIEKILMNKVDILVTINEEDYNFALKHFNVDTRYIKGIGFQSKRFEKKFSKRECLELKKELNIHPDDYVIIYVAELSKRKRQEYLLNVLSKMNLDRVKVIFAGNNILGDRIPKLIQKYGLKNKVKLLGFRGDIPNLLDISDLVISVSKQEGLPLNIMEAMKKEKAIIVTECRGNRDLIKNEVNGLVVPVRGSRELIEKIEYLKTHPQKGQALGIANREIIDQYSIQDVLPRYVNIYEELLEVDP